MHQVSHCMDNSLDNELCKFTVLYDISKTFDPVSHDTLLIMLGNHDIR